MVPINMAFFLKSSLENRVVALYPSPAGATESLLALESWNDIVERNPVLNEMESDVEGLLVNRLGYSRGYSAAEYYLLPIDECYKLVGLIRMHWKGLSGGTEVWRELGEFFTSLKARSVEAPFEKKRASRSQRNPMPDLTFHVEGAEVVANAATPLLAFKLRLTDANPEQTIHTVALRCQIQLEVTRRKYTAEDQERLLDLFGEPSRWGQTLRSLLWTHANLVVPSFKGSTLVDLPVPCTFDFNVAATKYFDGLADGEVPVCLQFSGTVFYEGSDGGLQVAPISWDKEARFKLPVKIWREMMESLLSQQRLALPAQRRFRPPVSIQSEARHSYLGRSAREPHSSGRDGDLMNLGVVEQIAKAVLYEGYMLYPYRPSSVKNQQRWNFGVLCPQSYSEAQKGS